MQLREKQKARRIYGVQERQFRRYFRNAQRVQGHDRRDPAGDRWSAGWTTSCTGWVWPIPGPQARQLVRHGHFEVNGHKHDVPSYLVEVGDVIEVRADQPQQRLLQDRWPSGWASAPCRSGCSLMRSAVGVPSDRHA